MSLDPGIFRLKTAADLFVKLRHDHSEVASHPSDSSVCFNFFVTAEHLPEWHCCGDAQAAAALKRRHALLRVCSHLANGAKHFETKARHTAVQSTHSSVIVAPVSYSGGQREAAHPAPNAVQPEVFFVNLDRPEAKELGASSISVTDLADRVMHFWQQHLGGT